MHANDPDMADEWEKKKKKEALSASQFKAAHKKFKETGELPPHLKKLIKKIKKFEKDANVKNIVVPGLEWMSKIKEESVHESVYQFKKLSTTQMDELDAALSRAGVKGTPDFNNKTWTIHKNPTGLRKRQLDYYIKSKGGKKIKESTDELEEWTVKQQKKYKVGTKMKPVKMGTQRVTKDKKYRILTIRQWLKFPNYARLVKNRVHHIDTKVDGKIKQLPIVFVDKQDKVVVLESVNEAMSESQRFKVYNSLKKGDIVSIK